MRLSIDEGDEGRSPLAQDKCLVQCLGLGVNSRNSSANSLVVLRLRLHAPSARDVGSIPGWGTKIPHATQHGQKVKKK